jgi:hypothetical protein
MWGFYTKRWSVIAWAAVTGRQRTPARRTGESKLPMRCRPTCAEGSSQALLFTRVFVKGFVQSDSVRKFAVVELLLWYIYRLGSGPYLGYDQGWDTDLPAPFSMHTRHRSLSVTHTWWSSR